MDSGSYNNVRRGAMPPSSLTPNAAAYKANVNRTKTRKWVEAKVQSYDGDDWGNDYDEYDDGNDQNHEPEPLPPVNNPVGLRQPGQTGHQLPSLRTFSQPISPPLPSNADPRGPTPSALRTHGGPLSLRLQTQQTFPATGSTPYGTESAHPANVSSAQANIPSGSRSAGPGTIQSRFPLRNSSMSQNDGLDINHRIAPKPGSPPDLSSGSQPPAQKRPASPSEALSSGAKTLPLVRPSDIYMRMEEKEKGFEGNNELDSARAGKPTLAPVAERNPEDRIGDFLASSRTSQAPTINEPNLPSLEPTPLQGEPTDEVKADLMKSRRFSTSPQLPTLTRMSGFGDDFFSSSSGYGSRNSLRLGTSEEEQRSPLNHTDTDMVTAPADRAGKRLSYAPEDVSAASKAAPLSDWEPEATKGGFEETTRPQLGNARPQIPGGWVSESTTAQAPSGQPTPLDFQEAQIPTPLANAQNPSVSPMTESDTQPATEIVSLPSPVDSPDPAPNSDVAGHPDTTQFSSIAGQRSDAIPLVTESPLKTEDPFTLPPRSTSPIVEDHSLEMRTSSMVQSTILPTTGPDFLPTAPLDPRRSHANQPDFVSPHVHQRQATISTIDTASPEKESDILREEIIKSLSPGPISSSSSSLPTRGNSDAEATQESLTRESTYLAGVYDDYLSPADEKSIQEANRIADKAAHMAPDIQRDDSPTIEPQDVSASQPAPLNSVKSATPESTTRLRRFSWQHDTEDVVADPSEFKPDVSVSTLDPPGHSQGVTIAGSNTAISIVSPAADSPQTESGVADTASHQVLQVGSGAPGDTSTAGIEPSPPTSPPVTMRAGPASDESSTVRLSLADEKQMVLIGGVLSTTSSASEQHPALAGTSRQEGDNPPSAPLAPGTSSAQSADAPTPFRDILNLATCEERVRKFEETREQFYVMDSGLSSWLTYLQGQSDHTDTIAASNTESPVFKPGVQPMGATQLPLKAGAATSHPRRSSIGNMQQLMAGHSGSLGASGNQVGTKSKELLHAAGVFGNKGMKSGMKLFNKGKNKLRERAAGDRR